MKIERTSDPQSDGSQKMKAKTNSLLLCAGDLVAVRTPHEILNTLDANGT